MSSSPAIDLAYDHCREITHLHGANFSVGFRFLPTEKRRAVYAAYAFCRRADDIADEPGTDIERRLDAWQEELERSYAGQPEDPITIALADSLQRFPIPKSGFIALIDGCRQDLVKRRYENFDELRGYCDLVATSISDISLSIFGYKTPRATEFGRSLATALQLTNITRDIGDDLQRDRIYLPQDEMREFGVSEADLVARRKSDELRALILFQIERAERYFREAQPLVAELDFDARFPTLLMGGVYATVLRKIRRRPFAPLEKRLRLSLPRKLAVIASRLLWPRFA